MQYLSNMKKMNGITNRAAVSTGLGNVFSFPEHITLMPLTRCNFQCRMCGEWKKESYPELPLETIKKLEPVLPFVVDLYITGGEPFMYPHLADLFAMGHRAGVDLSLVSNGSILGERQRKLILENGLVKAKFSIDAGTPKTYEHIRGGKLFDVLGNIKKLAEERVRLNRSNPHIQLGFVAMKSNIAELDKLVSIASQIGVDSVFVTYCQIYSEEMVPESLFLHQEYSDHHMLQAMAVARGVGLELELPPLFGKADVEPESVNEFCRVIETCREPWRHLFIRADGTCSLCCGGGGQAGNLNEMSFEEVWNHPVRVKARQRVNTENPPENCLACRLAKQNAQNLETHFQGTRLCDIARGLMKPQADYAFAANG